MLRVGEPVQPVRLVGTECSPLPGLCAPEGGSPAIKEAPSKWVAPVTQGQGKATSGAGAGSFIIGTHAPQAGEGRREREAFFFLKARLF